MKSKITILLFSALVILLFGLGLFYYQLKMPFSSDKQAKIITIEKGWGVGRIAQELQTQGIIKSGFYFQLYVWEKDWRDKLQAGTYELSPNLNVIEVARKIAAGAVKDDAIVVTIPPAQRIEKINEIFTKAGFKVKPNLIGFKAADFTAEFPFLKTAPAGSGLEGFLYPETFKFGQEATGREMVVKILGVFDDNIDTALRETIAQRGLNLYQVLTLASIVEQEIPASKPEDRKIVAGIFWNRLKNGQPLESCVTIEYVLGKHKDRYSYEDTRRSSPYNTYINAGLPPTPLASPRKDAVEAVVYFQNSDYNYFLSDPATGQTIFSKTFTEHQKNIEKYL